MKNRKFPVGTSVLFLYYLVLATVPLGCIESAPVSDEVKSSAPGFGSSRLRPAGPPLSFPSGIKVVDGPHWDEKCAGRSDYDSGMPPAAIAAIVQSVLYEVAHPGQLSTGSREKLLQLPDK